MASPFPKGPSIGPALGVGGSMRRAEGMGTSKLFGSEMRPGPAKIAMQKAPSGPTPGKPAFSAGMHQVTPHVFHSS